MLPYEGAALEIVKRLASHLRSTILGPYVDMADRLEQLGLYPRVGETLDKVLVWPVKALDGDAECERLSFVGLSGGARLTIKAQGKPYYFFGMGNARASFASANEFQQHINRLRGR